MNEGPLTRKAFFALRGFSRDWSGDLIRFLRSDEPMTREIREEMASALDAGTIDGTRLALSGGKQNADRARGIHSRREALAIGRFVRSERSQGLTRSAALERAADKFGASKEKCDQAHIYADRIDRWLTLQTLWPENETSAAEAWFHERDRLGEPPDK